MNTLSISDLKVLHSKIIVALKDCVLSHIDNPILFLYSGGSAMRVYNELFRSMGEVDLSRMIFAPVDERRDLAHSNAAQFTMSESYSFLKDHGATFVDCGDLDRPLAVIAEDYNSQLINLFSDVHEHEGVVISVLGMGADGHTAGIFPYPENPTYFNQTFVSTQRYVVGYDALKKSQYNERITVTVHGLEQIDYAFVYVTGEEKQEALRRALLRGEMSELPARVWQRLQECAVFTTIQNH